MTDQPTKQKRKRTWPNVYTRTHRSGQASYVVDLGLVEGKRERHAFKTKEEADTFALLKRTEKTNQGTTALTLPQDLRVEAIKAAKILEGTNVTLSQAAQYYDDHVLAYRNAPTVAEIVNLMIAEASQNERRPPTINELTHRLENFAADFPGARLSEISLDDLKRRRTPMNGHRELESITSQRFPSCSISRSSTLGLIPTWWNTLTAPQPRTRSPGYSPLPKQNGCSRIQ